MAKLIRDARISHGELPLPLLESDLSCNAKLLWGVLDSFGKDIFPGRKAIARRMSCSVATVKRSLAELSPLWLAIESGKAKGKTSTYVLTMPEEAFQMGQGGVGHTDPGGGSHRPTPVGHTDPPIIKHLIVNTETKHPTAGAVEDGSKSLDVRKPNDVFRFISGFYVHLNTFYPPASAEALRKPEKHHFKIVKDALEARSFKVLMNLAEWYLTKDEELKPYGKAAFWRGTGRNLGYFIKFVDSIESAVQQILRQKEAA